MTGLPSIEEPSSDGVSKPRHAFQGVRGHLSAVAVSMGLAGLGLVCGMLVLTVPVLV